VRLFLPTPLPCRRGISHSGLGPESQGGSSSPIPDLARRIRAVVEAGLSMAALATAPLGVIEGRAERQ